MTDRPYKVLMIIEGWHSGGTEQYVSQLCRYLRECSPFEVYVAVLRSWEEAELRKARRYAKDVFCLGKSLPRSLLSLRRIIRQIEPDVCHCHLYSSLLPVTLLLRALRVPWLVTTVHMPLSVWCLRHRTMWRAAVAMANHVVCNSMAVARSLEGKPGRRKRGPSIIPPPVVRLSHAMFPIERDAGSIFTVCGCGRLSREKDWPTLLRAFAGLQSSIDGRAELVHLGDGPSRDELRQLAARLGIEGQVRMMGRVEHSEVLARVRQSHVFVLPSHFEGLGMAALEAMQCGVPTITADFDASYDFIRHDVTGHRFPRSDWQTLRDLLIWHYRCPDRSRAVGWRGRLSVLRQFSEENTFGQYPQVYLGGPGTTLTKGHQKQP